ncbi:MAG: carboxypeptidase-like regulatory domain-containing protein, partial [Candidatus Hatepunaea meridiana]|nr:carboxypeptidase-like regulatory domain-containing protein [Candidatus Hatepunaea meridiana]
MDNYQKALLSIILTIGFLCNFPANAEITVNPIGYAISVEEDQEAAVELVLSNNTEGEVGFSISYELVENEEDRQARPRRDDLGDILETFELPYLRILGYAWDGEYMWGVGYNDNRLICIDPDDFDIIHDYAVNGACVAMTWDPEDEVFWLGVYNNTNVLLYDREGDHIRTINMADRTAGAFAYDGEFFYWYSRDLNLIRKLDRNLRNVAQIANFRQAAVNGQDIRGMTYVAEHDEGHFWFQTHERRCVQVDIDFDNNRVNQITAFNSRGAAHDGIAHDGRNLWTSGLDGEREGVIYDDGVREFDMLGLNPDEGVIQGDNSETIEITVITEDYEAGVYNILIEIELAEPEEERDDFEETVIQISGVVSLESPTAEITGLITDAADDDPIEGAFIELDRYIIGVYSDDEGNYAHSDLPAGEYELTFSAPDYLPTTEAVDLGEDDIELNVELLYAEFLSDEDQFFMALEPDMEHTFEFEVSNGGNGPLTYLV